MAAEKPLLPVYLFNGDDQLKREQLVKRLAKRVASYGDIDFNRSNFDGAKLEAGDEVVDACLTMPFCSQYRLVVIEDVDKAKKAVADALSEYLKDPCPSTVLALTATKLAKNTVLFKRIVKVDSKSVVECGSKKRYELPALVRNMAVSHGATMSQAAATFLIGRVGVSTVALDTELKKLASYVRSQGRETITEHDIDRLVARTAEVKPWDLGDALGARDAARCLSLIAQMRGQSPYGLLAVCLGRIRELIVVKALEERPGAASIASVLGGPDWRYKNHRRMASNFSKAELEQALTGGAQVEMQMKSGTDPGLALDLWIVDTCTARTNR